MGRNPAAVERKTTALLMMAVLCWTSVTTMAAKEVVLTYYTHQQFGKNEFGLIQAVVTPANGTRTGVGLTVVYDYTVRKGGNASSEELGHVRGTSVVARNTVNETVFVVDTVVSYADGGLNGTFSTHGEANFFAGTPWELAITGGTGDFRGAVGYTVGQSFSFTPPTANSTAIVVNVYEAHLFRRQ